MNKIEGRVWKYGDDVNTDVIFPGKYTYTVSERSEMAKYAMEDIDPEFVKMVQPGDIIVAGKNFGCGSSREQAVVCLKENQVGAIIAESFGRIYYRNCINNALPAIACKEAVEIIQNGDHIQVDLQNGLIHTDHGKYQFPKFPALVSEIISVGGLIPYTIEQLKK